MKHSFIFLILFLFPFSVFATPKFERIIDVSKIVGTQPVLVAIPEEVTLYNSVSKLRILEDENIVPIVSSATQQGQFGGVIREVEMCSIEGSGISQALHDGDLSTSVRPDPLKNPTDCTFVITFATTVRVHGLSLNADNSFEKITVAALNTNGTYTKLREVENTNSTSFSSVVTKSLQISLEYEIVPALHELYLQGSIPARILFEADPTKRYVLVYGDENPPKLPNVPKSLFATSTTPFVALKSEKIRDEDTDGDGLSGAIDNCPFVYNADQKDSDADGIGDVCDNAPGVTNAPQNDRDHDGIGDLQDNCVSVFNPDQRDDDLNGIGYECDDQDGDGIMNNEDNCIGLSNKNQIDSDGNGIGDACELDRDSDGIPDEEDNCRAISNPGQEDRDEDGIGDLCDSCPDTKNSSQEDRNENGIGDACEAAIQDPDGDGINNENDNCPTVSNTNQNDVDNDGIGDLCDNCPTLQNANQKDSNKDGQGDACTDLDDDGLLPHIDNCPSVANSDQMDRDNDGIGDACEDDDKDGILNAMDNCKYKSNENQADKDADGIGDVCDEEDNRLSEKYPWIMWGGMSFIVIVLLSMVAMMIMRISNDQRKDTDTKL